MLDRAKTVIGSSYFIQDVQSIQLKHCFDHARPHKTFCDVCVTWDSASVDPWGPLACIWLNLQTESVHFSRHSCRSIRFPSEELASKKPQGLQKTGWSRQYWIIKQNAVSAIMNSVITVYYSKAYWACKIDLLIYQGRGFEHAMLSRPCVTSPSSAVHCSLCWTLAIKFVWCHVHQKSSATACSPKSRAKSLVLLVAIPRLVQQQCSEQNVIKFLYISKQEKHI